MLGREVKDDRVAGIAEKGLAAGGRLEDAALALDPEVALEADTLGHQAHRGLRVVGVEVVEHQVPAAGIGVLGKQPGEEGGEIGLRAGLPELSEHRPAGHAKRRDEHAGAVADVLGLLALDAPGGHRPIRGLALARLDPGLLVDGDGLDAGGGTLGGGAVGLADVVAALLEALVALGVQPRFGAVGLEVGLLFKKRPTESGEIEATTPRLTASRANSSWVQWVIARPLSCGASQATATMAQIRSAVKVGGVPGRGASAKRSATRPSLCAQRRRQFCTVERATPKARIDSRTAWPAAAPSTMRARSATCGGQLCRRTSDSSWVRSRSLTESGDARFFVMPLHRRCSWMHQVTPYS